LEINTILVTGANGFVGRALCETLIKQSTSVKATCRDAKSVDLAGCEIIRIQSIDAETEWTASLDGVHTVIHLAARVHVMNDHATNPLEEFRKVNLHGTVNLAKQAARAGIKRFIYMSSVKVNGEHTKPGKSFTEVDIANPTDAYAISKYEAEQALLQIAQQTGMEVVIIRPPLVYGPGVKANFASMMQMLQRGIPLPFGAIQNKRSFVYVGNLVNFIVRCVEHQAAANQIFLVSDGHDLSTKELLLNCAQALKVKVRLLPIPVWSLKFFANILGKKEMAQRLCDNLQINISKAEFLLNWTPSISIIEGLVMTAKSFQKAKES
jgi:nucleoside-diphosphate-sugar epimerase